MKIMIKQFFFFLLLIFSICNKNEVYSEPIGEGFLGIAVGAEAIITKQNISHTDINEQNTSSQQLNSSTWTSPISFIGVAKDYYVFSKLDLFSDLTKIEEIFTNQSEFLDEGIIYHFSFFSIEVQYLIRKFKSITLLGGFNLGHTGFLSTSFDKVTYFFYIAPVVSFQWKINNVLMLREKIIFSIPVYKYNLTSVFSFQSDLEIILDPLGPVDNSLSNSILYSLGLKYNLFNIKNQEDYKYENNSYDLNPYFKVTLLY